PCCPAGRLPRLPELVDGVRLPVVEPVEDQRAIETSGGPPVLEDRPEGTPERVPARLPALGRAGGEGECPRLAVEGRPRELRDLALAHARPVRPLDIVAEPVVGELRQHREELALLEETFPGVQLLEPREGRRDGNLPGIRLEGERVGGSKGAEALVD